MDQIVLTSDSWVGNPALRVPPPDQQALREFDRHTILEAIVDNLGSSVEIEPGDVRAGEGSLPSSGALMLPTTRVHINLGKFSHTYFENLVNLAVMWSLGVIESPREGAAAAVALTAQSVVGSLAKLSEAELRIVRRVADDARGGNPLTMEELRSILGDQAWILARNLVTEGILTETPGGLKVTI